MYRYEKCFPFWALFSFLGIAHNFSLAVCLHLKLEAPSKHGAHNLTNVACAVPLPRKFLDMLSTHHKIECVSFRSVCLVCSITQKPRSLELKDQCKCLYFLCNICMLLQKLFKARVFLLALRKESFSCFSGWFP